MAITAVKLRVARKLNSMNLLSLLRPRRRHRKLASKPNSFAASSFDGLSKTSDESSNREEVLTPINDSSVHSSIPDELISVLLHAHQSSCPGVSSKALVKPRLQGSNIKDLSQEGMEQRMLAFRLIISFNTIMLILISELSHGWKRLSEIALGTTLSIKNALADIFLVILDLAFGLFVIMLYSRELSMKPLVLALDELKLLSTYFVAPRPLRSYSNELCEILGF
ncbi:hypothetical protein O6H91_09G061800 [Diphasiastrum complanatum]|uniref:Uncharacterized protein n=2 Tax=Diphasiastrum complanatum TaxID=34168 RepID=A0ACC2CPU1_DIPCM|nr:hypothetical protein O6H91_09G061800 [Diphasiastrum complanatum]